MLFWICLALVLVPLAAESLLLRRRRGRLAARVHVHGTRGKSAVVRLTAARLRALGFRVLAKTTGDAPEWIFPDGSTRPLRRTGPARIREHALLLDKASRLGADVVIAEGMALHPETVWMSERLLRATHAAVVNVRPDHEESMGPGREGVIRTLSLMIPAEARLHVGREAGAADLAARAAARRTHCRATAAAGGKTGKSPLAHPACLARALAADIAADLGHPISAEDEAPSGLAPPHDMNMRLHGVLVTARDLFSANDVLSTRLLLGDFAPWNDPETYRVALLATRFDRPLRTQAFLDWLERDTRPDCLVPAGSHAAYACLRACLRGQADRVAVWGLLPGLGPERLLVRLVRRARARGRAKLGVVCLGNARGWAESWRRVYGEPPCL